MPHDLIGWIHTIAALISLITGSIVLILNKGSLAHVIIGRIYVIAMLVVCSTSFMIYRVHGNFNVLHFFALISTVTLMFGMLSLYLKKPDSSYILWHLSWMYWSVIGLYCAFSAEIFTRIPSILGYQDNYGIFYALIGISSGLVGMIGARKFKKLKKSWEIQCTHN